MIPKVLLPLFIALVAGPARAAAENLLHNADLAELADGAPANWVFQVRTNAVATGDVVEDPEHGKVLHIRYDSGAGHALWVYRPPVPQPPFKSGAKYRITAWMKCQLKERPPPRMGPYLRFNIWGDGMRKLQELFLTPTGNIQHGELLRLDQLAPEVPWTKIEVVFVAPSSTYRWGLNLTTSGIAGDIWVGGFSLTAVERKTAEGPFVD